MVAICKLICHSHPAHSHHHCLAPLQIRIHCPHNCSGNRSSIWPPPSRLPPPLGPSLWAVGTLAGKDIHPTALTTPLPEVKSLSGQLFTVLTFHIQLCKCPCPIPPLPPYLVLFNRLPRSTAVLPVPTAASLPAPEVQIPSLAPPSFTHSGPTGGTMGVGEEEALWRGGIS